MKIDKITKLFKQETKEFHDFVQKPEDVKVVILNHQQIKHNLKKVHNPKYLKLQGVGAMVQINLCDEETETVIKVTGQGPDIITAFYMAKNKMIQALIDLQTQALKDESPIEESLPPQVQVQKLLH
jgi:hypothetical protein